MIFEKFVIAAKRQDPRNIFVASDYECKGLPEDVAKFLTFFGIIKVDS